MAGSKPGPTEMVSDAEIIEAIKSVDDRPVATTNEIVAETGLSDQRVKDRCRKLSENGEIEMARTGRALIYWVD